MSIVAAGRAQADKHLFRDSCVVYDVSVTENNGELTETKTQVYSGGCFARPLRGSDLEVAGTEMDVHMYRVGLPWDANGIKPGNVVEMTSTDGDLDGVELVVEDVRASSTSVARRLICRLEL